MVRECVDLDVGDFSFFDNESQFLCNYLYPISTRKGKTSSQQSGLLDLRKSHVPLEPIRQFPDAPRPGDVEETTELMKILP